MLCDELHHIHRSIADYFHSKRRRSSSTRFLHTIQSPKSTERSNKRRMMMIKKRLNEEHKKENKNETEEKKIEKAKT